MSIHQNYNNSDETIMPNSLQYYNFRVQRGANGVWGRSPFDKT